MVEVRRDRVEHVPGVGGALVPPDHEPPDLLRIAAGGDATVVARFDDQPVRLDPVTLAPLGLVDVVTAGTDMTTASPGTWLATNDGLVAVNGGGAPVLRVRDIKGALASTRATVWVLDRGAGGLIRVHGG